jgi:hypothetical protein
MADHPRQPGNLNRRRAPSGRREPQVSGRHSCRHRATHRL